MNPLTVDKISKKFLWWKDSGFLYTKQLIASLPKDWRFTILTPKGFDRSFFDDEHIIDCVEYDYSTSIHQNRYHFNRNIIAKALPYSKDIDVVLNMQPEVAANIKVFFENQRREHPIIVNYYHWIDCKESRNGGEKFIWRQVEGFRAANLNLFHTEDAIRLFKESCTEEGLTCNDNLIELFHPLPTTYGINPIDTPDKFILFNHRLNNTTGWKEIVKICVKNNVTLWLTDESNLKVNGELSQHPNIIVKSVPFESYGYLLSKAHFTVCNLQEYATWNMAVLDSINHGTMVLSNDTKLMNELNCTPTNSMTDSIVQLLSQDKIVPESKELTDYNLESFLTDTIVQRVKDKEPKKIEEVKRIINDGTTTKKDFVNKLWSFHANSNFQIIRWVLLSDGYIDDTIQPYTTYSYL